MVRTPHSAGRYEALEEIGRGSLAIVHRTRDDADGRELALKVFLRPNGIDAEQWDDFWQRLRRQAHRARRLAHDGIVAVREVGRRPEDGAPFVAMELVHGPTLHRLIRTEGALNPDWALNVTATLADALHAADQAGIVHPDLKPANVLVRESDGVAKISDFCAVRPAAAAAHAAPLGAQSYLAPECVEGGAPDLRSELFTLSVMLYEMLSGKPPFGGATAGLIRESIAEHPHTPITKQARDIAPEFDAFFDRALAKRPADRFQNVPDYREALAAVREAQRRFKPVPVAVPAGEHDSPPVIGQAGPSVALVPTPTREAERVAPAPAVAPARPQAARSPHPAAVRTDDESPRTVARIVWWSLAGLVFLALAIAILWATRVGEPPTPSAQPAPTFAVAPETLAGRPLPDAVERPIVPPAATEEPERATSAAEGAPTDGPSAPAIEPVNPPPAKPAASQPRKTVAKQPHKPAVAPAPPVAESRVATIPDATGSGAAGADTAPVAALDPLATPERGSGPVAAFPLVDLVVKSSLREGSIELFVDGRRVFSSEIGNDEKKWSRTFKKAVGKGGRDLESRIELSPGRHTISAYVVNTHKVEDYRQSIDVEVAAAETRDLTVVAGRTIGPPLVLRFE